MEVVVVVVATTFALLFSQGMWVQGEDLLCPMEPVVIHLERGQKVTINYHVNLGLQKEVEQVIPATRRPFGPVRSTSQIPPGDEDLDPYEKKTQTPQSTLEDNGTSEPPPNVTQTTFSDDRIENNETATTTPVPLTTPRVAISNETQDDVYSVEDHSLQEQTTEATATTIRVEQSTFGSSEEEGVTTAKGEQNSTTEEVVNTTVDVQENTAKEKQATTPAESVDSSTTEIPIISTSEEPVSSTSEEPVSSTSKEPVSSTSQEPVSSTTEKLVSTTIEEHGSTPTEEQGSTSTEEQGSTSTEEQRNTSTEEPESTSVEQQENTSTESQQITTGRTTIKVQSSTAGVSSSTVADVLTDEEGEIEGEVVDEEREDDSEDKDQEINDEPSNAEDEENVGGEDLDDGDKYFSTSSNATGDSISDAITSSFNGTEGTVDLETANETSTQAESSTTEELETQKSTIPSSDSTTVTPTSTQSPSDEDIVDLYDEEADNEPSIPSVDLEELTHELIANLSTHLKEDDETGGEVTSTKQPATVTTEEVPQDETEDDQVSENSTREGPFPLVDDDKVTDLQSTTSKAEEVTVTSTVSSTSASSPLDDNEEIKPSTTKRPFYFSTRRLSFRFPTRRRTSTTTGSPIVDDEEETENSTNSQSTTQSKTTTTELENAEIEVSTISNSTTNQETSSHRPEETSSHVTAEDDDDEAEEDEIPASVAPQDEELVDSILQKVLSENVTEEARDARELEEELNREQQDTEEDDEEEAFADEGEVAHADDTKDEATFTAPESTDSEVPADSRSVPNWDVPVSYLSHGVENTQGPRADRWRREPRFHVQPNITLCEWHFKTEPGVPLLLSFKNYSLPVSEQCEDHHIAVKRSNGYVARWCGDAKDTPSHTTFARHELQLLLYSENGPGKTGFVAEVQALDTFLLRKAVNKVRPLYHLPQDG